MKVEHVTADPVQLFGGAGRRNFEGDGISQADLDTGEICEACNNLIHEEGASGPLLYFDDRWRIAEDEATAQKKHDAKAAGQAWPGTNPTRIVAYCCQACLAPVPPANKKQIELDAAWVERDKKDLLERERLAALPATPLQEPAMLQSIRAAHPGLFGLLELHAENDQLKRRVESLEKKLSSE
jgi:hypothetical protein